MSIALFELTVHPPCVILYIEQHRGDYHQINAKKFLSLTLLLPVLTLAACEDEPMASMVRLKTESELRQIAAEECPLCTFVRMERKQYENICYFTDDACGFEFAIGSHATKMKTGYVDGTSNRWNEWIRFFLETVAKQCRKYIRIFNQINDLYEQTLKQACHLINSPNAVRIVDAMFKYPIFDSKIMQEETGISSNTINRYLNILLKNNVL